MSTWPGSGILRCNRRLRARVRSYQVPTTGSPVSRAWALCTPGHSSTRATRFSLTRTEEAERGPGRGVPPNEPSGSRARWSGPGGEVMLLSGRTTGPERRATGPGRRGPPSRETGDRAREEMTPSGETGGPSGEEESSVPRGDPPVPRAERPGSRAEWPGGRETPGRARDRRRPTQADGGSRARREAGRPCREWPLGISGEGASPAVQEVAREGRAAVTGT